MTPAIQFEAHSGEIKCGNKCLAFRHGWKMPDGDRAYYWFRGSDSMTAEERSAVTSAILTSRFDISGQELADKISAFLN